MCKLNITLDTPLQCALACLLLAVTQQPQALPQSLTTEYVRAGSRLIAIVNRPPAVFSDVSGQLGDEANLLAADGISSGSSCLPAVPPSYCPANPLTRDQMAALIILSLYVALQGPGQGNNFTYSSTPYFTDVPANAFAFKYIQKMKELGITAGSGSCGGTPPTYCPGSPTTNAQMAVFTTVAMQIALPGRAYNSPPTPQYFADVASGSFAFAQIQYVASMNVIPAGGNFSPDNTITRGQAAPYLVRGILGDPAY